MRYRRDVLVRFGFLVLGIVFGFATLAGGAEIERKTLDLKIGGSELVEINQPSQKMKIFISNEDIIGARPLKEDLISVYNLGRKIGYSKVTVWDQANREVRAVIDVVVSLDLTALKEKLHELYPAEQIEVYGSETGVVLSGTVSSPAIVEQVLRLTRTFLPAMAEEGGQSAGTGRSGSGITNLLQVGGVQQVLLEVKVAEVSRDLNRNMQAGIGVGGLGNAFSGAATTSGSILDLIQFTKEGPGTVLFPDGSIGSIVDGVTEGVIQNPSSLLVNFAGNPANLFINIKDFSAALNLMETEGLARILAEPRLVTQSGQEASFLAGGEFPVPVPQASGNGTTITIEFKEFGVSLRFMPVVMQNGQISLHVVPSVSEIASTSSIPAGIAGAEFNVPNLSTRRLETTVQLADGQSLALAGLLQDNLREEVRKVPGLGDIPILGQLFRSTSYMQNKTDLLIAVTPHLVQPVKEGEISFPGDNFEPPDALEFYLFGRLEGHTGDKNMPTPPHRMSGGLEGDFGPLALSEKSQGGKQ